MVRVFKFLYGLCLCLLTVSCSKSDNNQVIVHGNIDHLGKSELYISYYKAKDLLAFDTIRSSESGKFDFKLESFDEISPITIYFHDNNCWTTLFAKAGDDITISGDIEMVDLLNISGGPVNDDLNRFKKQIRSLYVERQQILEGKYSNSSGVETETRLAEINLALKRKAKEFIISNPSSVASVVLIQDFFYQDYDPSTTELLDILEGDASTFHMTAKIREEIKKW